MSDARFNPYPYPLAQSCPVCAGSGLVSRPPWVAGDQPVFLDTSSGPWTCSVCHGGGIVYVRAGVHSVPTPEGG